MAQPVSGLIDRRLLKLLAESIGELDKRYDVAAASKQLARYLADRREFKYARHDPRSKKQSKLRTGVMTPEIRIFAMSLVTTAWTAWVHQSKSIRHYKESTVNGLIWIDHEFIPLLLKAVAVGRSKALYDQTSKGQYLPEFRMNEAVSSLKRVLT